MCFHQETTGDSSNPYEEARAKSIKILQKEVYRGFGPKKVKKYLEKINGKPGEVAAVVRLFSASQNQMWEGLGFGYVWLTLTLVKVDGASDWTVTEWFSPQFGGQLHNQRLSFKCCTTLKMSWFKSIIEGSNSLGIRYGTGPEEAALQMMMLVICGGAYSCMAPQRTNEGVGVDLEVDIPLVYYVSSTTNDAGGTAFIRNPVQEESSYLHYSGPHFGFRYLRYEVTQIEESNHHDRGEYFGDGSLLRDMRLWHLVYTGQEYNEDPKAVSEKHILGGERRRPNATYYL